MDEFRNAMRQAMGEHLTDKDLDIMFMKVDTNCDGTVDWDEYLSYMLLEYRGKDDMNLENKPKPLPRKPRKVPNMSLYQPHHDSMIKISMLPHVARSGSNYLYTLVEDNDTGRYISMTKEGIVNYWNMDLVHLKAYRVEQNKSFRRKLGVWVTDFLCMPNLSMMAVATTANTITFYDVSTQKFDLVLSIRDLETVATCLDYWIDPKHQSEAQLLWGDARGNVCGLVFTNCPALCFLQPQINKHFQPEVSFNDLLKNPPCGVIAYKLEGVHEDYVLKIRYIPPLNTFLSCCRGKNTSLFQGDLRQKKALYFKVRKGVYAFDYDLNNNILVTGGKDTVVRVWNPYVQSKPVMLLQGHKSAILYVVVNAPKEQIISISEDKEINVFEMSTQTCIQTILRKNVPLGPRPISAMYFNQTRQALLLGTNQLAVFEHREEDILSQVLYSHPSPLTVVLYNKLFHQVISGGADSIVCVWDASTGERVIQFSAHRKDKGSEETEVPICCMSFDPTLRRLVTGAQDGAVKIWNFNNGALLRELEIFDKMEVSSIVVGRQRIITAGWNRRLTVYMDSAEDETSFTWQERHQDDILTTAVFPPSLVASASYDGDIFVWWLETGKLLNHLNAYRGTMSLLHCDVNTLPKQKNTTVDFDSVTSEDHSTTRDTGSELAEGEMGGLVEDHTVKPNKGTMDQSENIGNAEAKEQQPSRQKKKKAYGCSDKGSTNMSVEKLMFLTTRKVSKDCGCLVAAGADGWIRFWSVHPDGGLQGQFPSAHNPGESVVSMCTDADNKYLVCGDSQGYIKVWGISNYSTSLVGSAGSVLGDEMPPTFSTGSPSFHDPYSKFVFLREESCAKRTLERLNNFPPPPVTSNSNVTFKFPRLLNSFRAHLQSVTSLDYMDITPSEVDDRIVTCSSDCSIRLWTIYGQFLGLFNQDIPWSLEKDPSDTNTLAVNTRTSDQKLSLEPTPSEVVSVPSEVKNVGLSTRRKLRTAVESLRERKVPSDVRRVASATTLRVFFGGVRPHWKLAKNILAVWIPLLQLQRQKRSTDLEETDRKASLPDLAGTPSLSSTEMKTPKQLNKIKKAHVLGKTYKPARKYQKLPVLPKIRQVHNQVGL